MNVARNWNEKWIEKKYGTNRTRTNNRTNDRMNGVNFFLGTENSHAFYCLDFGLAWLGLPWVGSFWFFSLSTLVSFSLRLFFISAHLYKVKARSSFIYCISFHFGFFSLHSHSHTRTISMCVCGIQCDALRYCRGFFFLRSFFSRVECKSISESNAHTLCLISIKNRKFYCLITWFVASAFLLPIYLSGLIFANSQPAHRHRNVSTPRKTKGNLLRLLKHKKKSQIK